MRCDGPSMIQLELSSGYKLQRKGIGNLPSNKKKETFLLKSISMKCIWSYLNTTWIFRGNRRSSPEAHSTSMSRPISPFVRRPFIGFSMKIVKLTIPFLRGQPPLKLPPVASSVAGRGCQSGGVVSSSSAHSRDSFAPPLYFHWKTRSNFCGIAFPRVKRQRNLELR